MASYSFFNYGTNVDSMLTTSLSRWTDGELIMNVFNKYPLLERMLEKKTTYDGGASIIVPIMYDSNSTAKAFSYDDLLDVTPQQGILSAQAKWCQYDVSIVVNGQEVRMNSGKSKAVDLVKSKITQAEYSLRSKLTSDIFASSVAANSMTSFPVMFDATSSIQDINSTTSSWWQAGVTSSGSFAARGLSDMRTAFTNSDVLMPKSTIDTIVTTPTVFNYYEGSLTQLQRYAPSDKTGNASFQSLKFKTSDVMYDNSCPSGVMYLFPSDLLKLVVHTGADMIESEWRTPVNQDVRVKHIFVMLQLVCKARRKLQKLTGITA